MTEHTAAGLSRRGFGGLVGAAGVGGLTPSWASANEGIEEEFRSRDRGRPPRKPNVLVVLADDLGWADLSFDRARGARLGQTQLRAYDVHDAARLVTHLEVVSLGMASAKGGEGPLSR